MIDLLELSRLSSAVGQLLLRRHLKLVTAESCTGGLLAKAITDIAGCSAWYDCGFVVYSEMSKQNLLNVPASILSSYGTVSQKTVEAMVKGALVKSQAQYSIAITGIAGPGGASMQKPVGLVWFAWLSVSGALKSEACNFEGDRDAIRMQSVYFALKTMEELLLQPI